MLHFDRISFFEGIDKTSELINFELIKQANQNNVVFVTIGIFFRLIFNHIFAVDAIIY